MMELWAADSPEEKQGGRQFSDELLADFCRFFFSVCIDQIRFMECLLRLDRIESRIDGYVAELLGEGLLASESHRSPLRIGLPIHVLPYYFPDLYDPSVMGEE